jgi:hypothetical protein
VTTEDYHDDEARAARRVRLDAMLTVLDEIVGMLRDARATDSEEWAQQLIDAGMILLDELATQCRPPE